MNPIKSLKNRKRNSMSHEEMVRRLWWYDEKMDELIEIVQKLERDVNQMKSSTSFLKYKDEYSDKQIDYWIGEVERNRKSVEDFKRVIANLPAKVTIVCEEDQMQDRMVSITEALEELKESENKGKKKKKKEVK